MKFRLLALLITLATFLSAQESMVLKNGAERIHLTTFGEGDPLLIINGGPGMHSAGFAALAERLAEGRMTIIYDQRGTGKSVLPVLDSSSLHIDLMVDDMEVIRKHLGIDKWDIMGHSFGGMLASYYATLHADKIGKLILSSSGGVDMEMFKTGEGPVARLSTADRDSLMHWIGRIKEGDSSDHARYMKARYLAPAYVYHQDLVPVVASRLTESDMKINQLVFQSMYAIDFDCKAALRNFGQAVLIIQGELDIVPKETAEKAHHIFPNSKLIWLPECVHYGWLEQPELYFSSINEFLSQK